MVTKRTLEDSWREVSRCLDEVLDPIDRGSGGCAGARIERDERQHSRSMPERQAADRQRPDVRVAVQVAGQFGRDDRDLAGALVAEAEPAGAVPMTRALARGLSGLLALLGLTRSDLEPPEATAERATVYVVRDGRGRVLTAR